MKRYNIRRRITGEYVGTQYANDAYDAIIAYGKANNIDNPFDKFYAEIVLFY